LSWRSIRRAAPCAGCHGPNGAGIPAQEIAGAAKAYHVALVLLLFDRGIYVTLAAYPLVPRDEVGFRVQMTAANTDAEIDRLILALTDLAERGYLQTGTAAQERAA